jgi:hypothetical protein
MTHSSNHQDRTAPRRPRAGFAFAAGLLLLALAPVAAHAAEPDYSGWQALLKRYVRIQQPKGQPFDTRFDYAQLYIDEDIWTTHRADGLTTLHTQLLSVSPADLTPNERTAWAINTYNFLVIERMTLHLLVPRRKFQRFDSPKDINTPEGSFFAAPVAQVGGQSYSLGGFERRFVYGDTSADPLVDGLLARETPGDPRLACALSRAGVCSGPLLPWPYRADSLNAQLDRAARIALALPTWLRVDPAGTLLASNRFFEERVSFGGAELPGVVPFVLKHGPAAARRLIQSKKLTRASMFFEPSWKLNYFEAPKPKLPGEAGPDSTAKAARH